MFYKLTFNICLILLIALPPLVVANAAPVESMILSFDKGSSRLQDNQSQELRKFLEKNSQSVVVAVWSDQPFPKGTEAELPAKEKRLAKKRLQSVQNIVGALKIDLDETIFMSEKNNILEEIFPSPGSRLKSYLSYQDQLDVEAYDLPAPLKVIPDKGGPGKIVIVKVKRD